MTETRRSIAGGPVASRAGQAAWALYEFATGPYFIMVNIFVFSAYFSNAVVGDPIRGQALWGYIQGLAGFLIALTSPLLGALSDAQGPRKPGVVVFSLLGMGAMLALWLAVPGAIWTAAICVILAALAMEFASVHQQAMLPHLVSTHAVGFLSGLGYGLSNLAAVLCLVIWLALPQTGLLPDAIHAHDRIVGPLVALWCVAFITPLLIFTPDAPRSGLSFGASLAQGFSTLMGTFAKLGRYRNIAAFLIARMIYYDGLNAVFIFIGIYAEGVFGWSTAQVGIYALIVIFVAAGSAILGGALDDLFGSKRTILVSLVFFSLGVLGAISMSGDTAFFVVPIDPAFNQAGLPIVGQALASFGFATAAEQMFLLFGLFAGIFTGPAQASSRTLLTRLAPPAMAAEFFGLYTLTGRATSWLAPTIIAIVTDATQSQRAGFAVILIFLVVGFLLLLPVREPERVD